MKARLFLCSILLLSSMFAMAQEEKSFSLEFGTGFTPLHQILPGNVWSIRQDLAQYGQTVSSSDYAPAFTLSGVWKVSPKSEVVLTGGLSWTIYNVIQYGTFGTDPNGNPRYDLNDGKPAGKKSSDFSPSLTMRYRRIWTPRSQWSIYSGIGIGIVYYDNELGPVPELTVIGVKYSWTHFQLFLENTYGPHATLLHGGLGWRF